MAGVEDVHWWYRGLRGMIADAWKAIRPGANPRVLDVGCGTGANMQWLISGALTPAKMGTAPSEARAPRTTLCQGSKVPTFAVVHGIDFSTEALAECRKRGLAGTARGSALDLPFRDAQFDVVLFMDGLCHRSIADKAQPLAEIHRVLRPGGHLLLNLPAYQWLYSSHDAHVHTDRRFTKREMLGCLDTGFFEIVRATYWNSLLFAPMAIVRLWRKRFPAAGSDLTGYRGGISSIVFGAALRVERVWLRVAPMPFGLSLFAVARKR